VATTGGRRARRWPPIAPVRASPFQDRDAPHAGHEVARRVILGAVVRRPRPSRRHGARSSPERRGRWGVGVGPRAGKVVHRMARIMREVRSWLAQVAGAPAGRARGALRVRSVRRREDGVVVVARVACVACGRGVWRVWCVGAEPGKETRVACVACGRGVWREWRVGAEPETGKETRVACVACGRGARNR